MDMEIFDTLTAKYRAIYRKRNAETFGVVDEGLGLLLPVVVLEDEAVVEDCDARDGRDRHVSVHALFQLFAGANVR